MSNTIQVKRGANASLPTLNAGEFGFSTDTHQVYIGDGATNHEIVLISKLTTTSGALSAEIDLDISTHSSSADHDGRYYTETEVDTLKNSFIDGPLSPQRLTGFILSNGTNVGTGKVSAGTALLRTTNSESGVLEYFSVDEHDNMTITSSGTCYRVVLQYNGGTPQTVLQEAAPNYTTDITLGKFWLEPDNTIHYKNTGRRLNNGIAKLHRRAEHIRPWEMCTSIQITDEGSKLWSIAAGHFYKGINEFEFSKFDTTVSGNTFSYVYYNGADWVYVADQTEINVDQYNNIATGLVTCNKYKCDWVFVHPDDGHVYVVYGQDNNVAAVIEASSVPNVPDLVDIFGVLIGRIIINGGVAVFDEIEMVQTTTFNTTTVAVHNDLGGISGGTADERYHLTSAQHGDLTDSGDCSIHKHDDRYYTEAEVDTISGSLSTEIDTNISTHSSSADHDGRYYTETEVDTISGSLSTQIDTKANTSLTAIPGSNQTAEGLQCNDISAGESITVINCVYLHSDGEWHKTNASAVATAEGMLAISLESKTDGQAMNVVMPGAFVRDDAWTWTVGQEIYLSAATAAALTQTAPSGTDNVVRVVGHATHADRMFFNPDQTVVVHV